MFQFDSSALLQPLTLSALSLAIRGSDSGGAAGGKLAASSLGSAGSMLPDVPAVRVMGGELQAPLLSTLRSLIAGGPRSSGDGRLSTTLSSSLSSSVQSQTAGAAAAQTALPPLLPAAAADQVESDVAVTDRRLQAYLRVAATEGAADDDGVRDSVDRRRRGAAELPASARRSTSIPLAIRQSDTGAEPMRGTTPDLAAGVGSGVLTPGSPGMPVDVVGLPTALATPAPAPADVAPASRGSAPESISLARRPVMPASPGAEGFNPPPAGSLQATDWSAPVIDRQELATQPAAELRLELPPGALSVLRAAVAGAAVMPRAELPLPPDLVAAFTHLTLIDAAANNSRRPAASRGRRRSGSAGRGADAGGAPSPSADPDASLLPGEAIAHADAPLDNDEAVEFTGPSGRRSR